MPEDTKSYHLRRAQMEDRRAAIADDPASAKVHRTLGELHRQRASADPAGQTLSIVT